MYITDILQNQQKSQEIDRVKVENDSDSSSENYVKFEYISFFVWYLGNALALIKEQVKTCFSK